MEAELRGQLAGLDTEKDRLSNALQQLQAEHQLLMRAQCADKDLLEVRTPVLSLHLNHL